MPFFQTEYKNGFNFNTLKNLNELGPRVQNYLVEVYTHLAGMMFLAYLGSVCYSSFLYNISTSLLSFATMGVTFTLMYLPNTPQNLLLRKGLLFGLSFLQGTVIGPLLYYTEIFHPGVIKVAFISTSLAFASFTGSALLTKRRSYLFLGGILGSAITGMLVLSLFNAFLNSIRIDTVLLYLGILVFSGYVIYDTQLIVEKASLGHYDVVTDCLNLFTNFIQLFVRMIIVLSKQQEDRERKERESRNRRR